MISLLCHGILKIDFFSCMTNTEVIKCGFVYLQLQYEVLGH